MEGAKEWQKHEKFVGLDMVDVCLGLIKWGIMIWDLRYIIDDDR